MAAYSQDLRDRVLNALGRGDRPTDIALRFEVSRVWVYEVKNRFEREGSRTAQTAGGCRQSRIAHLESTLRSWILEQADLSLAEMCERLAGQGIQIKTSALWHQLNKWGLSFKKNAVRQRARARKREAGPNFSSQSR
ncbi:MAG: IS630 transposase-related protein [Burkholderiaceae bacterium]|jgi:transposase|nr:IS630 transposase-related protein [Burkholderiaceae bacterium]